MIGRAVSNDCTAISARALYLKYNLTLPLLQFDNKRATYSADWNTKDIESFVADEQMPLLNELNGKVIK